MEQAVRLRSGGAVTGWASCRLHGANFFDGLERDGVSRISVPMNVGPHGNLRADGQVLPCFHQLNDADRAVRHGIPTVTAVRSTYDAMRLAEDRRESVVAIDMMAAAELASVRSIREYADQQPSGHALAVWALDLASEHSRSPMRPACASSGCWTRVCRAHSSTVLCTTWLDAYSGSLT